MTTVDSIFGRRCYLSDAYQSLILLVALACSACQPPSTRPAPSNHSEQASAANDVDAKPPAIQSEDSWQVHYMQGAKIGFSHLTITPVRENDRDLVRIAQEVQISVQRFGASANQTVNITSLETPTGEIVRFET